MKIIYITLYGSSEADKISKKAIEENIEIQFWCVGDLYYNHSYDGIMNYENSIELVHIRNWFDLVKLLIHEKRNNVYVFCVQGLGRRTYLIQMMVRILGGGRICSIACGNGVGIMERVLQLPEKSIWDYIKPDIYFLSNKGYAYTLPSKKAMSTWNIQYTGTSNWERYLEAEEHGIEKIIKNKYAVFCDENLCQHIEAKLVDEQWVENAELYYDQCNKLFERIKEEMGLDVVIALHPSVVHNKEDNRFCPENRIVGKTIQLIKYAEFVILYASTSIDYAILYDKPVLYYTSSDLEKSNKNLIKGEYSRSYIQNLNARCLYLDRLDEYQKIQDFLCRDEEVYKEYIDAFIAPSENIKMGYLDGIFRWVSTLS